MTQHSNIHDQIEIVTFDAGEVLFEENETSYHFFIIQSGQVEVYKNGPTGTGEVVLATLGPGSSLGEFAMLDRQPRSASARALTDVTTARVSPEAYDQLLNELPDWAVSVMRALVERLRFTNDIVRTAQKSKTGLLDAANQKALEFAEFSDNESRFTRIRDAEGSVEHVDTEFDFSVYESDSGKTE